MFTHLPVNAPPILPLTDSYEHNIQMSLHRRILLGDIPQSGASGLHGSSVLILGGTATIIITCGRKFCRFFPPRPGSSMGPCELNSTTPGTLHRLSHPPGCLQAPDLWSPSQFNSDSTSLGVLSLGNLAQSISCLLIEREVLGFNSQHCLKQVCRG